MLGLIQLMVDRVRRDEARAADEAAPLALGAPRRQPNFNYTGTPTTECSLYPPGSTSFVPGHPGGEWWPGHPGGEWWWNATDLPELNSCQPHFTEEEAASMDAEAR